MSQKVESSTYTSSGSELGNRLRAFTRWLRDQRAPLGGLLLGHLLFVGLLVLGRIGALQPLELMAYDQALRWQTLEPPDSRIVLIGETEADIQRWGHPLPDGVMAEVLERLAQGRPRVIGVDKYRDIPVPPGSAHLDQVLRRHPEIIWIMKFGNAATGAPGIAPPPPWPTPIRWVSTTFLWTKTVRFAVACCISTMASRR